MWNAEHWGIVLSGFDILGIFTFRVYRIYGLGRTNSGNHPVFFLIGKSQRFILHGKLLMLTMMVTVMAWVMVGMVIVGMIMLPIAVRILAVRL